MSIATARIVGLDTAGIRRTRAELEGATERLPHVVPVAPDLGMILADDGGTVLSAAALQVLGRTDADVLQAAVEVAQQQAADEIAVVQPATVVVQDPDLAMLVVAAPSSLQGMRTLVPELVEELAVRPTRYRLRGFPDVASLREAL